MTVPKRPTSAPAAGDPAAHELPRAARRAAPRDARGRATALDFERAGGAAGPDPRRSRPEQPATAATLSVDARGARRRAAGRARRLPVQERARAACSTSARRRTCAPRAPLLRAAATGASRSRCWSSAPRDVDVVVTRQREGRAAARERADQAPQAALQRAAARRQAVPGAAPRPARDVAAASRRCGASRDDGACYFGPYTSSVAMHEAVSNLRADLPAALLPRGGVPRLRAARAALHRVRDEALPRARAAGSIDARGLRASWCAGTALFLRGRSERAASTSCARAWRGRGGASASRRRRACATASRRSSARSSASRSSASAASTATCSGSRARGGEVEVQVLHVRDGPRDRAAQGYAFSRRSRSTTAR